MNMFLTPQKTFLIGLRWSDKLQDFLPCPPEDGKPQFRIATPTDAVVHEKWGELHALPSGGSFNFSGTHRLIWGNGREQGLVREVLNGPQEMNPLPALTHAIARVIREELGLQERKVEPEDPPKPAEPAGLEAEGNSGELSGSGSGSTPTVAGSAETPSEDRP